MKKQEETVSVDWTQEFETMYILTCQELHRYTVFLAGYDIETAKQLLIKTYVEAYQRKIQLPSIEKQIAWLKKVAVSLSDIGPDQPMDASEWMESEEDCPKIDETSVFFEIEDILNKLEEKEHAADRRAYTATAAQSIFSIVLLIATVLLLVTGVSKIKKQLDIMREPFVTPMASSGEAEEEATSTIEATKIKIDGKAVFLSDIGQVLYSLPLEEAGMDPSVPNNPEIQKQTGWTYYLPCADRKDTQLTDVAPSLQHTLYRMDSEGKEIEIIAREVNDYTFWKDGIYVSQFDRVRRIDMEEPFERQTPGIYAEVKHDELYLYDTLGKTLKTEADGNLLYGDRIFKMSSNRIDDVSPAPGVKDHVTYYFKEEEGGQSKEIYRSVNGKEELFVSQDQKIDSFCIAGDWLYYSAYIRRGGSGAHYSELYRKSLKEDSEAEKLREEFTGRIRQMYFSEEQNQIYANYTPKNWKSNHGVIAVISMSGQISYLDDEVLRAAKETTGNDTLEFIMVMDDQVYCFWKDCIWEPGKDPIAIWRDVLVIPNNDRIYLEE